MMITQTHTKDITLALPASRETAQPYFKNTRDFWSIKHFDESSDRTDGRERTEVCASVGDIPASTPETSVLGA